MKIRFICVVLVGTFLATAPSALAATTIGETFDPTAGGVCEPANVTFLQTVPADYVVPTAGVITSWSHQTADSPAQLKLKVGRQQEGESFLIVGESALETPAVNALSTYPARISVQAGDVIGLYLATEGECYRPDPSYEYFTLGADPPPGTAPSFSGPNTDAQFDVSAALELDADADGFGDETQDTCPSDPTRQDCVAPETTITKDAPKKTGKHRVKFKFVSDEAGATFECKLDKKPYKPCSSPRKVKVDDGKHKFAVRATDTAGNVDPTPDKDKFKVVG